MSSLAYRERPAGDTADGLLILHHGRGADEHDLLGLADALDPQRRLLVVTPGGPLTLAGSRGRHWYVVPRVGHPDPATFAAAYGGLAAFHDELWERTAIAPSRTVLGGFSMGAVMSYALALGADRPPVAGLLAFSGFIPTVAGWAPDLDRHAHTRAFIAHGRDDPVISVDFARDASARLRAGGLEVEYRESPVAHQIDPGVIPAALNWMRLTLAPLGERL
ncbi:MAG: phospholipase [Acidobacteriota bacterium]|nr:phospholipase [Acidobacteriota bacterium]